MKTYKRQLWCKLGFEFGKEKKNHIKDNFEAIELVNLVI